MWGNNVSASCPRLFGGYLRKCWSVREIPKSTGYEGLWEKFGVPDSRSNKGQSRPFSSGLSLIMAVMSGAAIAIL